MQNKTNNKTEKNQGAVLVNRSIMKWQHFGESSYLTVFLTLLLVANHAPRWWKGMKIERGETVISYRSLSKICNLSQPTISKVLKGLEKSGEIERRKLNNFYCITRICKYNDYQSFELPTAKENLNELNLSLAEQEYRVENNINNNIYNLNENNCSAKNNLNEEEILLKILSSGNVIEQFCKNERITVEQFQELAREVIFDWKLTGTTHVSEHDTKRHLLNTIRIKIKSNNIVSADLDSRLAPFIATCKSLIEQGYHAGDVREFYRYWTQPCNDRSGRLLFESVRAWDAETKFLAFFKKK